MMRFYRKPISTYVKIALPVFECMRLFRNCSCELFELEKAPLRIFCNSFFFLNNYLNHNLKFEISILLDRIRIFISFFPTKLIQTQTKYFTFYRKLRATYLAMIHLRHVIEVSHMILLTDLCNTFHKHI